MGMVLLTHLVVIGNSNGIEFKRRHCLHLYLSSLLLKVLARSEQNDDGTWFEDPEQTLKKKCDFIISAFGSTLASDEIKVKDRVVLSWKQLFGAPAL